MKRGVTLVVVVSCILTLCTCATVSVNAIEKPANSVKAVSYTSASASISISDSTATSSGKIRGIAGKTTKTTVHLYLQKYANGSWTNVADWTSSGNTVNRILTKTKTVSRGYKYRSKAVCCAYIGSKKEKVVKYSNTTYY